MPTDLSFFLLALAQVADHANGFDQTALALVESAFQSAQAAAATQLPRTGSSTLPALIGGLVMLVTGALAATAKRRRHLGSAALSSEQRP